MYQQYKDKSEWLLIYIQEAHPADGNQSMSNVEEGIKVNQPKTMEERIAVAKTCVEKMNLTIIPVIDGMDNKVGMVYDAGPDRLYIVDKEGKIAYKGEKGPGGFRPLEMEITLKKLINP